MDRIKVITVFLGSRTGTNPRFAEAVRKFAMNLAQNRITLLYGGGNVGLMGELASTAHRNGGRVVGVIPDFLFEKERPVKYDQLITVHSMMERKTIFFEGSIDYGVPRPDAIVTMSGAGDGTIDELAEGITLAKLSQITRQPQVLLNLDNFWQGLLMQRQRMVDDGYIDPQFANELLVVDDVEKILPAICQDLDKRHNNTQCCTNGTNGRQQLSVVK